MSLKKKDQDAIAMILTEMYDNDLNPEIETTKHQPYFSREDDDGVDWDGEDRNRQIFLRKFKNDDVELGQYIWGDPSYDKLNAYDDDEWRNFFSYAFDIPVEKLKEIDIISRSTGGRDDYDHALQVFKKAGLDGRILMDDKKREEFLR